MPVGIQPQTDIAGKEFIFLLTEFCVDFPRRGPDCGTMFLSLPRPALVSGTIKQRHDIHAGAGQDGQGAVGRPVNIQRIFQRLRQLCHNARQAAAQGLSDQQRYPNDGNIKEQADNKSACF